MPHGGKRERSGRKPKLTKELALEFFSGICSPDDLKKILRGHLSSDNPKISYDAATWLADHVFGKAVQKTEQSGPDGGAIPISLEFDL